MTNLPMWNFGVFPKDIQLCKMTNLPMWNFGVFPEDIQLCKMTNLPIGVTKVSSESGDVEIIPPGILWFVG